MMCSTVVDLLEPMHDGELDIEEQVRVENHLALCAACHATARELRDVREMMSAAMARDPLVETDLARDLDAMSQSVVSQVRSEREASWPRRRATKRSCRAPSKRCRSRSSAGCGASASRRGRSSSRTRSRISTSSTPAWAR